MTTLKSARYPNFTILLMESSVTAGLFASAAFLLVLLGIAWAETSIILGTVFVVIGIFLTFTVATAKNNRILEPGTLILNKASDGWHRHTTIEQTLVVREKDLEKYLASFEAVIDNPDVSCSVDMKVKPITANPKVREMIYRVKIKAVGDLRGAIARRNLEEKWKDFSFQKWLRFQLYEFQEKKSVELAEFYNPESHIQQRNFRSVVKIFLNEELAQAGFELEEASFSC